MALYSLFQLSNRGRFLKLTCDMRLKGVVINYGEGRGGEGRGGEGRGVLQNGMGGGQVKFYPFKKGGGGGKSFSHSERGKHKRCLKF